MDFNYMFIIYIFIFSLGLNMIFFLIAFTFKSDAFTDITYALTFIFSAAIIVAWKQHFSIMQIVLFACVVLWGVRIGGYLLRRILKIKVDHRFDNMRNHFFKFLGFWILQAITVFLIFLPVGFALSIPEDKFDNTDYYGYIFIFIALIGLLIETIADEQKFHFYNVRDPKNQKFIKTGLWKISRHPNYFGEIVFWLFLTAGFLSNLIFKNYQDHNDVLFQLLWLASPLYLIILLNFVSGLPLLEKATYLKLKDNSDYQAYVKGTSIIIPYLGKRNHVSRVRKLIKKNSKAQEE